LLGSAGEFNPANTQISAFMVIRRDDPHLLSMASIHPHADAEYLVVRQADNSYGVRVLIPDQEPTLVIGFASQVDAEAWADKHRQRVRATQKNEHPSGGRDRADTRGGSVRGGTG
jgi:hypothetical protein